MDCHYYRNLTGLSLFDVYLGSVTLAVIPIFCRNNIVKNYKQKPYYALLRNTLYVKSVVISRYHFCNPGF